MILNRVCFLQAYILHLDRISAWSTWQSIQLFSVTSKFVCLPSKLFRQLVYMLQNLTGESWEEMLSDFRDMVSDLYAEWEDCLMQFLKLSERSYLESIRDKTATTADLKKSLYKLSHFLAEKFCQGVIVLIDEYEAPNNHAYDHGYFVKVCSLDPSMTVRVEDKYLRPMSSLDVVYFLLS